MKIYKAIIIGSGAAAYSVADWLFKENISDIAIVTESRLGGTSCNTGSDKQTYYKLSMDGFSLDSPYKMASDIFSGGSCDGEKLYLQALYSTRCFLRLCDYGVPFPQDEFGGFPGYKTDHDNTVRATSVGPLTSKLMTERLEDVVLNKNKTILLDNRQVTGILKQGNRAIGVAVLNTATNTFESIFSENVICATGAPACIYENSVYPHSQHGMTGVLLEAGVRLCNYSQWQYGLASVDFRWNVSGSFMQVIPRFISVDDKGNEEEFLNDYFESKGDIFNNIFLKGYQWPFSSERAELSSKIDIAVRNEAEKGRKVYLDYTKNPKGFSFDALGEEAKAYLEKNNALADTPIERLQRLNPKAIDVYKNQGIDIYTQPLRIAVCAQHNNGGVYTDNNYETDVKSLYVIGEAAGTFGLARPGGTALNDTQVSGLLCAKHIKNKPSAPVFTAEPVNVGEKYKAFELDENVDYSHIKVKMSNFSAFLRKKEECEALLLEITDILNNYPLKHKSLSAYFYDKDMLLSAKALLQTILGEMQHTGSRGGAIFTVGGKIAQEDKRYRELLTITANGHVSFEKARSVPVTDEPFEKYLKSITLGEWQ